MLEPKKIISESYGGFGDFSFGNMGNEVSFAIVGIKMYNME